MNESSFCHIARDLRRCVTVGYETAGRQRPWQNLYFLPLPQ